MITCMEKGRRQVGGGGMGGWRAGRDRRREGEREGGRGGLEGEKGREIEEEGIKRKSKGTFIIVRVSP